MHVFMPIDILTVALFQPLKSTFTSGSPLHLLPVRSDRAKPSLEQYLMLCACVWASVCVCVHVNQAAPTR